MKYYTTCHYVEVQLGSLPCVGVAPAPVPMEFDESCAWRGALCFEYEMFKICQSELGEITLVTRS